MKTKTVEQLQEYGNTLKRLSRRVTDLMTFDSDNHARLREAMERLTDHVAKFPTLTSTKYSISKSAGSEYYNIFRHNGDAWVALRHPPGANDRPGSPLRFLTWELAQEYIDNGKAGQ